MEDCTGLPVSGRCMIQRPQDHGHAAHLGAMLKHVGHVEAVKSAAHPHEFVLALGMSAGLVVSFVLAIWLRPAPRKEPDPHVPALAEQSVAVKSAEKQQNADGGTKADMGATRAYTLTSINLAYGFSLALQGLLVAPLEAQRLWPEGASQALGAFAAIAAIAQLIGPEVGHVSDTYRSSLGRRRPMLIVSVAAVGSLNIGLWYFALVRARFAYVLTLLGQQIGWNVVMSTQAGLAPDVVPEELLAFSGAASAANVLIGAFLAFVAMANLTYLEYHYYYGVQVIFLLSCCALVCVLAGEQSSLDQPGDDCKTLNQWCNRVVENYSFDWRSYPDFTLLLVTKTLYCASVVVKMFLFFFCQDTFNLPSLAAEENLLSKCAVGAEVGAALSAILTMMFVGQGSKRALRAVIYGAAWMGVMWNVCSLVGYRAEQVGAKASPKWSISLVPWFIFGTTIWGFGQGAYLAGDQALSLNLLPDPEQASRYLAFSSICAFVGTAIGGLAAGGLLSSLGGGQKKGYAYPGYIGIFTFAVVLSWILAAVASFIRVRDSPDEKSDADVAVSQKLDTKS
mmetsp:Transcript_85888/g.161730  ORF Transcript_85888/g.161730 Transcript_85888/m.161730 type:complete len:565 (+) Transcript_85888:163-1857(+)